MFFIIGMLAMLTMVINLKVLLRLRKITVLALCYFIAIAILIGFLYHMMKTMHLYALASLALYFIPPFLLTGWMIKRGYNFKNALSVASTYCHFSDSAGKTSYVPFGFEKFMRSRSNK